MSDTLAGLVPTRVRDSSRRLLWIGIAMAVLGLVAIVFPVISTIAAVLLVGWVFVFAGALMTVGAFNIHGTGPFFGALLIGLLTLVAGLFLVFNPIAGAVTLTILLGVLFLFQGAFELVLAFEMRPQRNWVWMLFSGAASVILAIIIAVGLPGISAIALGILLGINFLSTGLGYIFISRAMPA
jgi:uncharacterized membrane protein HdeD (DUF308 family)